MLLGILEQDIAHNVYVARGRDERGEGELTFTRIFVWPRNSVVGAKAA
jgi:hypothetical protein